jgi:hypothetical protein
VDARKSLFLMSLIGALPGGLLAFFGVMGGISGAQGGLMLFYFGAAAAGTVLALLPVTIITNLFPKTGPAKPKAAKADKAAEKGGKEEKAAAAVTEPGSEELDVAAGDDEEFVAASDEFEAVSDGDLEFGEVDEFEEEEEEK